MTQEDKDLVLRDLCARLPYNVWVSYKTKYDDIERATILNGNYVRDIMEGTSSWIDFKPYLRPRSSMTEDELQRYHELCDVDEAVGVGSSIEIIAAHDTPKSLDYLNSIHVDYRGLIPKDLALSTEIYNPYKD